MFLISGGIVILLFVFLIIFAFPQFSPIPYYPSNYQDKNRLLKSLNLKNNQLVIDLGAGDGWVIFAAASTAYQQKLNTQFIAAEINPFLILLLYGKRFLHPNKKNITIKFFNILKDDYQSLAKNYPLNYTTFYLYLSPWFLPTIWQRIASWPKPKTIVAYYYPINTLTPVKIIKGINNIYLYNFL
jgi:hypothetical protein